MRFSWALHFVLTSFLRPWDAVLLPLHVWNSCDVTSGQFLLQSVALHFEVDDRSLKGPLGLEDPAVLHAQTSKRDAGLSHLHARLVQFGEVAPLPRRQRIFLPSKEAHALGVGQGVGVHEIAARTAQGTRTVFIPEPMQHAMHVKRVTAFQRRTRPTLLPLFHTDGTYFFCVCRHRGTSPA